MMNICNYVRCDYLVCILFCRHDWLRIKLLRRHSVDMIGLGMSIRTVCNVPEQVMWCQVECIFYWVCHIVIMCMNSFIVHTVAYG